MARDTLGPTLVILPDTPAGNTPSQTAAVTVQTPGGGARPRRSSTSVTPGEVEPTLEPCDDQACAAETGHLWMERPIPADQGHINYVERSILMAPRRTASVSPITASSSSIRPARLSFAVAAGECRGGRARPGRKLRSQAQLLRQPGGHRTRRDERWPACVFAVYLRSVDVRVGQRVEAGSLLGLVGLTGVAIGAHLHFEVRVGANDYESTRNPELWLLPLPYAGEPQGVIAGSVRDPDGNWLPEVTVVIQPISTESDRTRNRFIQTYSTDASNPDERFWRTSPSATYLADCTQCRSTPRRSTPNR